RSHCNGPGRFGTEGKAFRFSRTNGTRPILPFPAVQLTRFLELGGEGGGVSDAEAVEGGSYQYQVIVQDAVALGELRQDDPGAGLLVFVHAGRRFQGFQTAGEAEGTQHPVELAVRHVGALHRSLPLGSGRTWRFSSRIFFTASRSKTWRMGTNTRTVFAPRFGCRSLSSRKYCWIASQ